MDRKNNHRFKVLSIGQSVKGHRKNIYRRDATARVLGLNLRLLLLSRLLIAVACDGVVPSEKICCPISCGHFLELRNGDNRYVVCSSVPSFSHTVIFLLLLLQRLSFRKLFLLPSYARLIKNKGNVDPLSSAYRIPGPGGPAPTMDWSRSRRRCRYRVRTRMELVAGYWSKCQRTPLLASFLFRCNHCGVAMGC